MPFGSTTTDHVPVQTKFTGGETSAFGQVFDAASRRAYYVDSAFGMPVNMRDRYYNSIERAGTVLGKPIETGWTSPVLAMDPVTLGLRRAAGQGPRNDYETLLITSLDNIDKSITEAKKLDPSILTFQEVYEAELGMRRKLAEEYEAARNRSNADFGILGQAEVLIEDFLGSAIGSVDPQRDPLFFATNFLPIGMGNQLWKILMKDAFIAGGAVGAQNLLFETPRAQMLGEEPPNIWTEVLVAGLTGAGIRGGLETLPGAYRALVPENQGKIIGRELLGLVERNEPDFALTMRPSEMLEALDLLKDSPEKSIATAALINDTVARELTPKGLLDTPEGRASVEEQVGDAFVLIENAKPMNPESRLFPEGIPEGQVLKDVLDNQPEVKARLDEIDGKLTEAQQSLDIALEQQRAFKADERVGNVPSFDEQIQAVRARFENELGELEQIRKEARTSPENAKIIEEKARITRQAQEDVRQIGSVRFMTGQMLKEEITRARRTLRDQRQVRQNLLDRVVKPQAVREKKIPRVLVPNTEHVEAAISAPVVPNETRVEPAVATAKESVKAKPEDKRPPVLGKGEVLAIKEIGPSSIEDGWRLANEAPGSIEKIEALSAQRLTAKQVANLMTEELKPLVKDAVWDGTDTSSIVRAVRSKLNIPSMDQKTEFEAWLKDYNLRTSTKTDDVKGKALDLMKEQGLGDQIKAALAGEGAKPTVQILGKDVPLDLDVPGGPRGTRKVIQVLDEIEQERAMLAAARECGLGTKSEGGE